MPQNRFDPRPQLGAALEGGATLPDFDEGLLDQVAGQLGVPQCVQRARVQRGEERPVQLTQCLFDRAASLAARLHEFVLVQGAPDRRGGQAALCGSKPTPAERGRNSIYRHTA